MKLRGRLRNDHPCMRDSGCAALRAVRLCLTEDSIPRDFARLSLAKCLVEVAGKAKPFRTEGGRAAFLA
jgi:hypothetical protein